MISQYKFIISHKYRIVYALIPKSASTTMHKIFLDSSGIVTNTDARSALWGEHLANDRRKAGIETCAIDDDDLDNFLDTHRDYLWISLVRNPYQRCVSGYNQQIWRYAERFDKRAMWKGKLAPYMLNPLKRNRPKRRQIVTDALKAAVSFDQFLDGLIRHGTSFDRHFEVQSKVIRLDRIRYHKILKVENFEIELREIFGDQNFLVPRMNKSASNIPEQELLTPQARDKVFRLYEADFNSFGYAR